MEYTWTAPGTLVRGTANSTHIHIVGGGRGKTRQVAGIRRDARDAWRCANSGHVGRIVGIIKIPFSFRSTGGPTDSCACCCLITSQHICRLKTRGWFPKREIIQEYPIRVTWSTLNSYIFCIRRIVCWKTFIRRGDVGNFVNPNKTARAIIGCRIAHFEWFCTICTSTVIEFNM